ncbi:MAG: hydroxymethylbilane synthase [Candidatus Eiseniibacteriota bacterium]
MRIGTRGSTLALAQSALVRRLLPGGERAHEVRVIETSGDRNPQASLRRIGGKGVFTKEIEQELLDGRIDLAVHSLKDLPTEEMPGLQIGALLRREDPRDAVVTKGRAPLAQLPPGSKVGTSSLRRQSQLLARRPDLAVADLRGNVPTRIARVREGALDAIVIAAAGLRRLGLIEEASETLDEDFMLPAPGQGILALQIRAGDARMAEALSALDDQDARAESEAERSLLSGLGGGCLVPVGARGRAEAGRMMLAGFVGHPSGRPSLRMNVEGVVSEAAALGRKLAEMLLQAGAKEILAEVRSDEIFP